MRNFSIKWNYMMKQKCSEKRKEKHFQNISFLLLHSKKAQTYWFKITAIYYLTSPMGQLSVKYRWVILLCCFL